MSFETTLQEALLNEAKLSTLTQIIMNGGARLEWIYNDSPDLGVNLKRMVQQIQTPTYTLLMFFDQWCRNLEQECVYTLSKGNIAACIYGEYLIYTLNRFLKPYQSQHEELKLPPTQAVIEKINLVLSPEEYLQLSKSCINQAIWEILILRLMELKQLGLPFDKLLDLAKTTQAESAITNLANYSEPLLKLGYSLENLLSIATYNPSILAYLVSNTSILLNSYQLSEIAMTATLPNALAIFTKSLAPNKTVKKNNLFFSAPQTIQAIMEIEQSSTQTSRKISIGTASQISKLKKTLPAANNWYLNPLQDNYIWIAPSNYNFIDYKKVLAIVEEINIRSNFVEKYVYDEISLTISLPKNLWAYFYPNYKQPQHALKHEDLVLCTQTAEKYIYHFPGKAILVCNSSINALVNANHLKYLWEFYRMNKSSTEIIKLNQNWIIIDDWYPYEKLLFPQQQPRIIINLTQNINFENHYHLNSVPNIVNLPEESSNTEDLSDNNENTQLKPY